MTYDDCTRYAKVSDLITNRVKNLNQVLGARYACNQDNPCRVTYRRGTYVVEVCGSEYARWGVYDLDGIELAFRRLDTLFDGVWLLNRSGRLSFSW